MNKIGIIGEILVEIMATEKNQTFIEPGTWLGPYASGAPAIFINQACKLGAEGLMWGTVGDDDFGKLCVNHLQKNGVDTSAIKTSSLQSTGVAFVRYEDNGERYFIYHIDNAASGDIELSDISQEHIQSIGYFHVMGTSIFKEEMIEVYNKILSELNKNTVISLDPNIRVEILRKSSKLKHFIMDILTKTHIFFTTDDELHFLLEQDNVEKDLNTIFKSHPLLSCIIVKKAEKGATLYNKNGEVYEVAPLQVTEVDPTGAGDSFAGAFIAALSMGYSHTQALEIANVAGGYAVSKQGPMEGQVTLDVIKSHMTL